MFITFSVKYLTNNNIRIVITYLIYNINSFSHDLYFMYLYITIYIQIIRQIIELLIDIIMLFIIACGKAIKLKIDAGRMVGTCTYDIGG